MISTKVSQLHISPLIFYKLQPLPHIFCFCGHQKQFRMNWYSSICRILIGSKGNGPQRTVPTSGNMEIIHSRFPLLDQTNPIQATSKKMLEQTQTFKCVSASSAHGSLGLGTLQWDTVCKYQELNVFSMRWEVNNSTTTGSAAWSALHDFSHSEE